MSDDSFTWVYVPHAPGHNPEDGLSPWCLLVRCDGLELGISKTSGKAQLHISQSFGCDAWVDSDGQKLDPRQYTPGGGRESLPSINVAVSKSIATIARDVRKRVLPDAVVFHLRALDTVSEWNTDHATRDENGKAMGCDAASRGGQCTRRIYETHTPNGVGSVDIEAAAYGIEIKIDHMSIERALAVLKALGIKVTK